MKFTSVSLAFLAAMASVDALNVKKAFRFGRSKMPEAAAPAPAPVAAAAPAKKNTPTKDVSEIFEGNKAFIADKLAQDAGFFDTLGTVHQPKYLYIGMCSTT